MFSTNNIIDRVDQSMTSAISMLFPIASMNHDRKLQQTFFDVEQGVAISGFRRQVANFGVALVVARYGSQNEVEIGKNDFQRRNGSYYYVNKQYVETNEGLLGTDLENGERERVDAAKAFEKVDAIRNAVEARFEAKLSPDTIYRIFEKRKRIVKDMRDRKLNIQFTAGLPTGTMIAQATLNHDKHTVMVVNVPTKTGRRTIEGFVDRDQSTLKANQIIPGRYYLVKPAHFNKETGLRTMDVLRTYKQGVRMAIQHFNMGLIRPGDPGYGVNPNPNNGIPNEAVVDMPFMDGQPIKMIKGAPMLSFDLDMFYNLMRTLRGYESVTMKFKDSTSGVYFFAEGDQYLPDIEAILGPTIQYVRGRVWLP